MRRIWLAASSAVLAACAATPAGADPAYRASDIVAKFAPALGGSRSICVGSESECARPAADPKANTGFDLVVNFEYNSDVLTRPARANLDEFATALKDPKLGRAGFVVEGHTDGTGGDEFNLELSMRRANAVVSYLEGKGVPADRLEAKGYGKQRPLVSADPMASANRRVETKLRTP